MQDYPHHKGGESKMARYFFHIASEHSVMPDHQGRECSCAEDAFFHARRMIDEAARYLDEDDGRWVVRVRTAADSFKLDVPFFSHRASPWAVDLGEVHGKINNGR